MRMPTVMNQGHTFSRVPQATIERSQFNRSHGLKTTFDSGYIVPIFVDEALPGDTFNLRMNGFCRLATPLKPVMDNLYIDTFFFAVPLRLVWANFQKFMGEQINPGDSTSFVIPTTIVPVSGYATGTVQDYFGLPTLVPRGSPAWTHSALPYRAFMLIYNQWFRDENLCTAFTISTGDGPDVPTDPGGGTPGGSALQRRGKRHDYFTSCLPWPQKGTAVPLLLSGMANVLGISLDNTNNPIDGNPPASAQTGGAAPSGWAGYNATSNPTTFYIRTLNAGAGSGGPLVQADLGSVSSPITINDLRRSFQIQKLLERDARGGTRYTEIVRSHFGVTSPDARLQRPEYLGGGSAPLLYSPVAQTAPQQAAGVTTPQGNLSGFGTGSFSGHGFAKSFTEHCLVLGFASVRADLTYQYGLDRMWSRSTRYDFYWPALAHIGEQAVLNQEIYVQGTAADAGVFGYQERYGEYRYKQSRITGKFRSNATGTLHVWHLAQEAASLPVLNQTFIEENPPLARVNAVSSEPQLLLDAFFDYKCARPMPVFGVPGLIDHF